MSRDTHSEREITFDGALALQDLSTAKPPGVARADKAETEVLDAVYFDTADLGLLRHGVTLRHRAGGHDAGWHLKIPDGHGGRHEVRCPLTDERPEEEVPQDLRQLACAYARGQQLRPVAHLMTHRRRVLWLDAQEQPLAELSADHVAARVLASAAPETGSPGLLAELSTWDETEVELAGGDQSLLDEAAQELSKQGLRRADHGVKLARALSAAGLDVQPVRRADIGGAGSATVAIVSALRQQADRLTHLDSGVRLDEKDAVHQMRVTARRLRGLLRSSRRLFDTHRAVDLSADLRWLGHQLGSYREPEALRDRLTRQAHDLPAACTPHQAERKLRTVLDRRCRRAHQAVLTALSSPRFFTLLDRLEEFTADPPLRSGKHPGSGPAARILRHEARRTRRRLRKATRLPAGERQDAALHRARKAAKRTRYVAGALAPVLGPAAKRQEDLHKKIHKRLGRHQDARTAEQALAALAHTPGTHADEAFAFGILQARQRVSSPADIAAARRTARL